MKKLILFLTILFLSQNAFGASLNEVSETKSLSNTIMSHFEKEEFVQGLDIAKNYWPLPPVEIDSLANQINTQWSIVRQRFGKTIGTEFIREEKLGKSFVRYYFLHKFDHHAIYWSFTYYRPQKEWIINSITFQDDFSFLFEKTE